MALRLSGQQNCRSGKALAATRQKTVPGLYPASHLQETLWLPHSLPSPLLPGFANWIRRFNRAFDSLCQQGRVGVGRSSGRFKPRAIVAIAVDENDRICDTLLMKGLTVFASPQKIPTLSGKHLEELQPDVIFPNDPLCQNALSLALNPKHA